MAMSSSSHVPGFLGRCDAVEFRPASQGRIGAQSEDIDLVGIARWCQNYLANNPLPNWRWQCRFSFWALHMPILDPWPFCATGEAVPPELGLVDPIVEGDTDSRMDYAYAHMREMAGSYPTVQHAEEGVRQRILGRIEDDGLCWIVNPWLGGTDRSDQYEKWAFSWATGKALYTQSQLYRLTQEPSYRALARKLFEGLHSMAAWDTGRAYYGGPSWDSQKWARPGEVYPWVVEPVVSYCEVTGDEEALDFARAFADGMLANLQPGLGRGAVQPDGSYFSHAHCELHAISGVAHLGALTREPKYIEWARRVYEFVRNMGTDYGWFPESYTLPDHQRHTEICLVADMTYTAAWLAAAGYPSYYEHVERYGRNMLRNAQFFATEAYEALYRDVHADEPPDAVEEQLEMIRGLQGGFVASPTPNDLVDSDLKHHGADGDPPMLLDLMGCCPPEGMRALRTVWRHAVTSRGSDVFVNMALPCEHEEAHVSTSLPDQGAHSVLARRAGNYYIRPPEWAPREDVSIARNGAAVEPTWRGDYILLSRVMAGEQVSITYPLPSFVQHIDLTQAGANSGDYIVAWVGNTVTGIEPNGRFLPLFGERRVPPFPAQEYHQSKGEL